MAAKPFVLLDLNIILDVLQKREPFNESSSQVLASVETGLITGCLAALPYRTDRIWEIILGFLARIIQGNYV